MSTATPFHILTDENWLKKAPAPTHNANLATRVDRAVELYKPGDCKESTTKALSALSKLGIVALSSLPEQPLVAYIANTLLNASQRPTATGEEGTDNAPAFLLISDNKTPIRIPCRSTLILSHISERLNITIRLFSTRATTRAFGSAPTAHGLAFLHCVDSFHKTGQYLILGPSRHLDPPPLPPILAPSPATAPAVSTADQPPSPAIVRAVYRDEPRSRKLKRESFSLEKDDCEQMMRDTR